MRDKMITLSIVAFLAAPLVAMAIFAGADLGQLALACGMLGMAAVYRAVKDANVNVTKALSNGAGAVSSDAIDLGHGDRGAWADQCSFKLSAPALTTVQLPDTETMTYIIEHDTDPAFGTVATLLDAVIIQTGAAAAGAAAATKEISLPQDAKRYIRFKATKTGTGDCTGVSGTLEGLF